MNEREWHIYWMRFAYLASTRATCERKSVGAVIVKDNKIISTGYNGQVAGTPHCQGEAVCNKDGKGCQSTIHAELNALLFADYSKLKDSVIYITMTPCEKCLDYIANCGIKTIYYNEVYRIPIALEKAKKLGIETYFVEIPENELTFFNSLNFYLGKNQNAPSGETSFGSQACQESLRCKK